MYKYDTDYIVEITGISVQEAESLLKYFAKLPVNVQIEAIKLQTDFARQNKKDFDKEHGPEYYYAMLLVALRSMKRIETAQATKDSLSEEEAEKLRKIRIERIRAGRGKKASKKEIFIKEKMFEEIKKMRMEEGLSWREISEYIAKYHKTKISHGYLQQKFSETMLYEKEG